MGEREREGKEGGGGGRESRKEERVKEGEEGTLIFSIFTFHMTTALSFASETAHWNQSTIGTGKGLGTHELASPLPGWH